MNALGDWRYVTPEDIATFGGLDQRREALTPEGSIGANWLSKSVSVFARSSSVEADWGRAWFLQLLPHCPGSLTRPEIICGRKAP